MDRLNDSFKEVLKSCPGYCVCDDVYSLSQCVCCEVERTIRWFSTKNKVEMTEAQRQECIEEICSVEGYSMADCEGVSTQRLARLVLAAWTDYARDKGLL